MSIEGTYSSSPKGGTWSLDILCFLLISLCIPCWGARMFKLSGSYYVAACTFTWGYGCGPLVVETSHANKQLF